MSHARTISVQPELRSDAVKLSGVSQIEAAGLLRSQWWENTLHVHYNKQR